MPPTVVDVQLHFILVRQNKSMFPRVTRAPLASHRAPPGGAPHYLRRTASVQVSGRARERMKRKNWYYCMEGRVRGRAN